MSQPSDNLLLLGRVVFRLLLVVSLWEGPVVWGHSHRVAMMGPANLTSHIASYHECDTAAADLGWHWHFSIPATDGDSSGSGQSSHRLPPTVLPAAELATGLAFLEAYGGLSGIVPAAGSLAIDGAAFSSVQMRGTAVVRRSPPADLSSRLRC